MIGGRGYFRVVARGSGLNYQWRRNGVNLAGETGAIYYDRDVTAGEDGNYSCVISNTHGSATSLAGTANDKINYIGQIPHNEIWNYLNDAHIGVIPFQDTTLCQYNTPTKLFEYMGSNCGIVSSNLPPIKAFCPDSVSWAKPGDLNSLIDAMTYSGFDKKGVLVANNTVVNGSMHYTPFLQKYFKR